MNDEFVIDKWCQTGSGKWTLVLSDPMPSLNFARAKLRAHCDTLTEGEFRSISPTHFSWTRLWPHTPFRQSVIWRVRNASRQPFVPEVWANIIDS